MFFLLLFFLIIAECEDPAEIANGYMATNPVRTIGSVVEWGCDAGYRLFGPANSVCMLAPGASKPEFTESPRCYSELELGPLITATSGDTTFVAQFCLHVSTHPWEEVADQIQYSCFNELNLCMCQISVPV